LLLGRVEFTTSPTENDLGPTIDPNKDLITRSMLRRIQEEVDFQKLNGLHGL